ncbi:DUF1877 family protein [Rothia sp. ARF10]|nr:DUF1877 family protein [Rothia sp. ARF10]
MPSCSRPTGCRPSRGRWSGIDTASLGSRRDAQAMEAAEVYPMIWDESDVFDSYLAPLYEDLRGFYAAAAAADEAVIQAIT